MIEITMKKKKLFLISFAFSRLDRKYTFKPLDHPNNLALLFRVI